MGNSKSTPTCGVIPLFRPCLEPNNREDEIFDPASTESTAASGHDHLSLINASEIGDIARVQELSMLEGINVNDQLYYGMTALQKACSRGHLEVVNLLIGCGADTNVKGKNGLTPLHEACCGGFLEVVKSLIDHAAHVNAKDNHGQAPLHLACSCNDGHDSLEIIKLLIEHGADVNSKSSYGGKTPLHRACYRGRLEVAKLLIQNGADIDVKNNTENYNEGLTPFYWACQRNHLAVAKLLIENGADVDVKDKDKFTPLQWACENRLRYSLEVAKSWACENRQRSLELAKFLIENGADVNTKNNEGFTPLHRACWKDDLEIVKLLIENGVEINAENEDGQTALHLACENGHSVVVWSLVRQNPWLVVGLSD